MDHQKKFFVAVYLGRTELARATGMSKKEAQRLAAKKALESLTTDGLPDEVRLGRLGGNDPMVDDKAEGV